MSVGRRRLSAQESRAAALEAARVLLVEQGPQAVTLKAVAERVNRTHANLLHHFGSAAGLQLALADHLAATICDDIAQAAHFIRVSDGDPRRLVDLVFDTFGSGGGAALAAWMLNTGHKKALDPILEAMQELIDETLPPAASSAETVTRRELTYSLVLMALGMAIIGDDLAGSLAVDDDTARRHGQDLLVIARERLEATT
ncbi:TetR/AcrR family transcriptional regulator [Aurantiacibacter xanthus]|uniref:TetR/AcrR family transcriptional regulator n=1 Tax=Aurantiacibacter xanthus TaxID=1784712 RepID=A0A3A1P3Q0_9SPHN|nr:TetR/AcrR family transcriptional regulator [Aurantiacibacter xanthus]RIV85241.1 TetR/AcrR family transcriptional regulator [Aurantiacibacter xanthus]